jgi:2-oxo-4-hydroxy-4-carboxy-5-ureidoimidazoline decarboxylase
MYYLGHGGHHLSTIDWFNNLDVRSAEKALQTCCRSARWARTVAAGRPYKNRDTLVSAGDLALAELGWNDVREALDAHPRIGERIAGGSTEASWSRGEQAGMDTAAATVASDLATVNQAYEQRFDHVFLICATGLPAEHMLAEARRRLTNDPAAERRETVRELGKIVRLRLEKLVTS